MNSFAFQFHSIFIMSDPFDRDNCYLLNQSTLIEHSYANISQMKKNHRITLIVKVVPQLVKR